MVSDPETDGKLNEALKELERVLSDNEEYRDVIDKIHVSYKAEMEAFRAEYQKDIDHLHKEIERAWADIDRAREDANAWRYENNRKGQLIDKYMEKIVSR